MKPHILCVHTIVFLACSWSIALADDFPRSSDWVVKSSDSYHSLLETQSLMLEKSRLDAPISSRTDLELYLMISERIDTPLDYLPESGRERFLESLEFGEGGLASFYYGDLVNLELEQLQALFSLFGLSYFASSIIDADLVADDSRAAGGEHDEICSGPGPSEPMTSSQKVTAAGEKFDQSIMCTLRNHRCCGPLQCCSSSGGGCRPGNCH